MGSSRWAVGPPRAAGCIVRPAEDAFNTVNAAGRATSARCTAARAAVDAAARSILRAAPHTTHYTTCEHRQNTAPWFLSDHWACDRKHAPSHHANNAFPLLYSNRIARITFESEVELIRIDNFSF